MSELDTLITDIITRVKNNQLRLDELVRAEQPVLDNLTATTDPGVGDDIDDGYSVTSTWVNVSTDEAFINVDNTAGAAVWVSIGSTSGITNAYNRMTDGTNTATAVGADIFRYRSSGGGISFEVTNNEAVFGDNVNANVVAGQQDPGRFFLGNSRLDYQLEGSLSNSGDIQYTQVFLPAGITIDDMEIFLHDGGGGGNDYRLGIYDQSDPSDFEGTPDDRIAQTAVVVTVVGDDDTFVRDPLTAPLDITTAGYYWLAMIANNTNLKLPISQDINLIYARVYIESGAGTTLPASSGTLTQPDAAIAYVAAIKA